MRIYQSLILIFLISCEFSLPETVGKTGVIPFNLKSIEVTCKEKKNCKKKKGEELSFIALYTISSCVKNSFKELDVFAVSESKTICKSNGKCEVTLNKFFDVIGGEEIKTTINERSSLLVFVDVNQNDYLDEGEPVNCNDNVQFGVKEVMLKVDIKRVSEKD